LKNWVANWEMMLLWINRDVSRKLEKSCTSRRLAIEQSISIGIWEIVGILNDFFTVLSNSDGDVSPEEDGNARDITQRRSA
jgi:hypothetical protein